MIMHHAQSKYEILSCTRKIGFTLAEVLLTITVIGIIASLTIPDLVAGIQEDSFKAAWKKDFSVMAAATQNIMNDNGGTMVGFTRLIGATCTDSDEMTQTYARYLNVSKNCTYGSNEYQCWHLDGEEQDLRGRPQNGSTRLGLILTDGTLVRLFHLSFNCTAANYNLPNSCGVVVVDINGFKKPNIYGRDMFGLHIFADGSVKPFGTPEDDFHRVSFCSTTSAYNPSETQGWACSYNYLLNMGMEN